MDFTPFSTTITTSFIPGSSLPSRLLASIATSGCLDEISNAPGSVLHYINNTGLVQDGKTRTALFFAIYQTERYGPQNGFRLCLVNEGFNVQGNVEAVHAMAAAPIEQGAAEYVVLGEARLPILDNAVGGFEN